MKEIFIQELNNYDAKSQLEDIGFDSRYLECVVNKYRAKTIKICNLTAIEANILKQAALSAGSDCAVHKNVILNADGQFDGIICTTVANLQQVAKKLSQQQFRLKNVARLIEESLSEKEKCLKIRNFDLNFTKNKYIMGILNITPNSFSDGNQFFDEKSVENRYISMEKYKNCIIDIGAQSTKPNFEEISVEEEIRRLNLLFNSEQYKKSPNIKSIDTYKYKVAQNAINNGIDIINDVTGFSDTNMIKLAVDFQKPIVVMFNQRHLETTDKSTFEQMYEFFVSKIDELINAGIKFENIILDCGFGFFKNNDENFMMLKNLANLKNLKCPILLGISRKSFLKNLNSNLNIDDISSFIAMQYIENIDILRVHDISKHFEMIKLLNH